MCVVPTDRPAPGWWADRETREQYQTRRWVEERVARAEDRTRRIRRLRTDAYQAIKRIDRAIGKRGPGPRDHSSWAAYQKSAERER